MMKSRRTVSRRTVLKGAALGTAALILNRAGLASAQTAGPSTTVSPYLLPSQPGVDIRALLTVGDLPAANGYRMVGIPDGLGAFRDGGGGYNTGRTFTLLMNHELRATTGIPRAHGARGAFVSRWTIERSSLRVLAGEDLTPSPNHVYLWNGTGYVRGTTAWDRLCSADLPDPAALRHGSLGTAERIFFNGEEVDEGRAWARIVTGPHAGEAWQLAKVWAYGIDSGELVEVAHHDPEVFLSGGTRFITQDEESSGIIDAQEILGEGWFLLDVQVHKANPDPELVEGGQLLAMYVHPQIGRRP